MRHFLRKIQRFESKRFEPESNNTKGKLCNFLHRQCNICRKKRTKSGGFLSNLGLGPFLQRRDETNRTCLTKCTKIVLYEKQSFKKSFENNSRRQPGATLSSPLVPKSFKKSPTVYFKIATMTSQHLKIISKMSHSNFDTKSIFYRIP